MLNLKIYFEGRGHVVVEKASGEALEKGEEDAETRLALMAM